MLPNQGILLAGGLRRFGVRRADGESRDSLGFLVEILLPSSRNLQLVAGDGWLVPACALQNALRSFHIGPIDPFPKVFFRAQSREFLRYSNINQLIQSNTLRLRNTLCLFEQRRLQSKSDIASSHECSPWISCQTWPGAVTRIPKLLGASLKCRVLYVTRQSALPFTAVSRTISSAGSLNIGLQRKRSRTGSITSARASSTAFVSSTVNPIRANCSALVSTASYSSISGTEARSTSLWSSAASRSCRDALIATERGNQDIGIEDEPHPFQLLMISHAIVRPALLCRRTETFFRAPIVDSLPTEQKFENRESEPGPRGNGFGP